MVCGTHENGQLKIDLIGQWMDSEWLPRFADQDMLKLQTDKPCINRRALAKFTPETELVGGYRFIGSEPTECDAVVRVTSHIYDGELTEETGANLLHFTHAETGTTLDVLIIASHYSNEGWDIVCVAAIPVSFVKTWTDFEQKCLHFATARDPQDKVIVIGGHRDSFVPKTAWDEVVLPVKLKSDILDDVESFFRKGVDVYKRLNLKPFRKLLLAGVPGTGKTMLCTALAKWALEQGYLVIYVSSALRRNGDDTGARFDKIDYALSVAAESKYPALILLEELDAYLNDEEKALILNVLDGAESQMNEHGTLLVSTTNYPEAIDERILKRPGRLDRIFIVPEMRQREDAEKMLKQYLGVLWREEHAAFAPKLIGYPGAFVREVAIYALTQVAYSDGKELPLDLLEQSFRSLKDQIDARDDFLKKRNGIGFGQTVVTNGNGHN